MYTCQHQLNQILNPWMLFFSSSQGLANTDFSIIDVQQMVIDKVYLFYFNKDLLRC